MRLRRLELWWRRLWIKGLVRLMRRAPESPRWKERPHRVLFLRHDRAGDMVLSTGVLRAIARSHPTITLDVLASPLNAPIIEGADYVATTITFDKRALGSYIPIARRLRRAKYDAVVDCMVTAPSVTTLLLVLASGARHRIGISGRGNDDAFTLTVSPDPRPDGHMVDRLSALVQAFGVDPATMDRRPSLDLSEMEIARAVSMWAAPEGAARVLVNISAGSAERTWPDERYVEVMRHIHERHPGAVLRVVSAPSETERATRVANAADARVVSTPTIRAAFALVATADLVITPDTSIAHAASALRVPAVAMYSNEKSERWGLYDNPGRMVIHPASSLEGLAVDRVINAVDAVWEATLSRRG
ncbi:MAG TPA: glycosyltransferase family 9 protein [Gemmatimonadaceae bacterium]|jgi:ADP-heptose:LPS heptosyltransferase|nr:glycosyltransferase family 9 protein [Gemmatimonadaceae bacterium]